MQVMRWLAERFMKLLGWRFEGVIDLPDRFVAIGAPHTSNWDFMLFLAVVSHFRVRARVIGKATLVGGPFGRFMRRMGVIPTERGAGAGLVELMKNEFDSAEKMALVIAPEGTRSATDHWKSGFYRIAMGAGVPVVCAFVNYPDKVAGFGPVIELTGDVSADMDKIRAFYKAAGGARYPEKVGVMRLREE